MVVREVLIGLDDAEITDTLHLSQSTTNSSLLSNEKNKKSKNLKRKAQSQSSDSNGNGQCLEHRIKIAERLLCCSMLRGQDNNANIQNISNHFLYLSIPNKNISKSHMKRRNGTSAFMKSSNETGGQGASLSFLRNASKSFTGQECITLLYLLLNISKKIQLGNENYLFLNDSKTNLLEKVNGSINGSDEGYDFLLPLPDIERVADWVSAIIDSNFTNLVR